MFTQYDFYKGMFCELGGEFVDTDHEDLQTLAKRRWRGDARPSRRRRGEDLYFFKGQFHTPKEMIDPATKSGAFAPIAKQIAKDADKLTDKNDEWTAYARKLDQMSLKTYLEQFRGKTDDWAIDVLDVAYNIEFGLLTEDQSSLNMVDFITTDLSKPFSMFGESDEVFRIKGGSVGADQSPGGRAREQDRDEAGLRAGHARPQGRADRHGLRCTGRRREFGKLRCRDPGSAVHQAAAGQGSREFAVGSGQAEMHSRARLRAECQDLAGHHLARVARPRTRACPRHRTASSIPISVSRICGTQAAPSRATPASSPITWASSPALGDAKSALDAFRADLPRCRRRWPKVSIPRRSSPGSGASIPYTLGSYASAKVGQYTTMLEVASEPALGGRLQFAGEHTSSDFSGLYEWWRAKRQPRRQGADQDLGTAQMSAAAAEAGERRLLSCGAWGRPRITFLLVYRGFAPFIRTQIPRTLGRLRLV